MADDADDQNVIFEHTSDGISTLLRDGKRIGWVGEIRRTDLYKAKYRAMTTGGHMGYFWTLDAAKDFLLSEAS